MLGGAHGPQDADFAGALRDADRQHTCDAKGHGQCDEKIDDRGGQRLRAKGVHELRIGFHPALGFEVGQTGQSSGDVFCLEQVKHRDIDDRHRAKQSEQGLCLLHVQVDKSRIELAHAKLKDAGDGHDGSASRASLDTHAVAHPNAEVICELLSNDRIACANLECALHDVLTDRNDFLVAFRINAHQGDGLDDIPPPGESGARHDRRHRADLGQDFQRIHGLLPVVDRAQALCPFVLQRQVDGAGRVGYKRVDFIGRLHPDVGLCAERALDDVVL